MADLQRVSLDEVVVHFQELEDPRSSINQLHPLVSVVVIALLAVLAWRHPVIQGVKVLPKPESADDWVGAEAEVRPIAAMSAMDAH